LRVSQSTGTGTRKHQDLDSAQLNLLYFKKTARRQTDDNNNSMTSSTRTSRTHFSSGWAEQATSNSQYHQEKTSNFSTDYGGFLSGDLPRLSDPMDQDQRGKSLETAEASLKEREARLNEREAELSRREETLTKRENALDAAHERLIGVEEAEAEAEEGAEDESDDKKKASPSDYSNSATIIEELRQENSTLRAELAAANKRSGRFLSQRAQQEDASGFDRFKLSERKPRDSDGSAGGLRPMGFDPQLMARWKSGHEMMSPRKPRPASSRPDGK